MSLDGFVGGPNGELDWLFRTTDEAGTAWTVNIIRKAGLHIMGSKTFHDMAAWWPTSTEAFAAPMNEIPKAVFTKKGFSAADPSKMTAALRDATEHREEKGIGVASAPAGADSWAHPQVFQGDLSGAIRRLKEQPGKDIIAHGGAGFAQSLVTTGLIDEYNLLVAPVALGKGLSLFSSLPHQLRLQLVEIKTFPSGSAAHIYLPVTS